MGMNSAPKPRPMMATLTRSFFMRFSCFEVARGAGRHNVKTCITIYAGWHVGEYLWGEMGMRFAPRKGRGAGFRIEDGSMTRKTEEVRNQASRAARARQAAKDESIER